MAGMLWRRWMRLPVTFPPAAATPLARRGKELLDRHFRLLVLAMVVAFLLLQLRYVAGLPLVMDEFANAGHIIRVARGVPYRDYAPYKTVLGYYILLPGLVAFTSSWAAMLAAKVEIAILTSLVLGAASLRLRRHFGAPAVLGALLVLCTQSTFLERASELRVDMLSALFGLVSLIAFLERRATLAGVAAAGAVLMTQKGAYFAVSLAGGAAFLLLRWRSRAVLAEAVRAALAAAGVFVAYLGFWCVVGGPLVVWQSIFEGPRRIAFEKLYDLTSFWAQTLERNPIFYAIGAAGWLLVLPRRRGPTDTASERLWAYSFVHVALCIWHKQPWPYFFVMFIPTVWVLCAAALDRQLGRGGAWQLAVTGLVVVGAVAQAVERVPAVLQRSAIEQRRVVEGAEAFLQPGDTYLAGTELLWRRGVHIAHLSWLDKPHLDSIRRNPAVPLRELREAPPRLVVENYRVQRLAPVLVDQLRKSFLPVGGNLWTYAPLLPDGASVTLYVYGGLYRVAASQGGRIRVDGGRWLGPGDRVTLASGVHAIDMVGGARLAAWSEAALFVEQTARPSINLFERVYTY